MTDIALDISALEELDFDAEFPCEHSQHKEHHHPDEPAKFLVAFNCTSCGRHTEYLCCEPGVVWMVTGWCYQCPGCQALLPNGVDVFYVIRQIKA